MVILAGVPTIEKCKGKFGGNDTLGLLARQPKLELISDFHQISQPGITCVNDPICYVWVRSGLFYFILSPKLAECDSISDPSEGENWSNLFDHQTSQLYNILSFN